MSRLGMVHHRIENVSEEEWETLGRWAGDEDLVLVAVPKDMAYGIERLWKEPSDWQELDNDIRRVASEELSGGSE